MLSFKIICGFTNDHHVIFRYIENYCFKIIFFDILCFSEPIIIYIRNMEKNALMLMAPVKHFFDPHQLLMSILSPYLLIHFVYYRIHYTLTHIIDL